MVLGFELGVLMMSGVAFGMSMDFWKGLSVERVDWLRWSEWEGITWEPKRRCGTSS